MCKLYPNLIGLLEQINVCRYHYKWKHCTNLVDVLPASGSGRTNAFNWTSFLGNVIWTLFPADTTNSFITGKEVNTQERRN